MLSYFKPLRRKIGMVSLLLARVFAACWIATLDETVSYPSLALDLSTEEGKIIIEGQVWFDSFVPLKGRTFSWTIPYWTIVIPLTILSPFLLLSEPRVRLSKPELEL